MYTQEEQQQIIEQQNKKIQSLKVIGFISYQINRKLNIKVQKITTSKTKVIGRERK